MADNPSMSEQFMNYLMRLKQSAGNFLGGLDDKINDPALLAGMTGPHGRVQLKENAIDPALVVNQLMPQGRPAQTMMPIDGGFKPSIMVNRDEGFERMKKLRALAPE